MLPYPRRLITTTLALAFAAVAGTANAVVTPLPSAVTVQQGGASSAVTVSLAWTSPDHWAGTGVLDVAGLPAGVAVVPSPVTYSYATRGVTATASFILSATPMTMPGTYSLTLRDLAMNAGTATLMVTVVPDVLPSFSVRPNALSVDLGSMSSTSAPILVSLTFPRVLGGPATGTVSLAGLPSGVLAVPATITYPCAVGATSATASFQILVSPGAAPGTYALMLTDQTQRAGSAMLSLTLVYRNPAPQVLGLAPSLVVAGSAPTTVHIIGRNFDTAGHVDADTRGLQVLASRILSGSLAEITLAAPDNAVLGPRDIRVVNSDGQRSAMAAQLVVAPPNPLLGSLSVSRLATLFPQPGTVLGQEDHVHARGVVVVTGEGTLTGAWLLDGVPFDRFMAPGSGGYPVEITSSVPIPTLTAGEHRLELAIDTPQRLVSQALALIGGDASRVALRLLSPADDAALKPEPPPEFRWMPAPGASGYEVELIAADRASRESRPARLAYRVGEPSWTPDQKAWREIAGHAWLWRVRPMLLADTLGDASEAWRMIVLPAARGAQRGSRGHGSAEVADASASWSFLLAADTAPPTVTAVVPANGAMVADQQPIIDAQWSESGALSVHAMSVDGTDVTELATWSPGRALYRSIVPLPAGNHTVLLSLNGQATGWTFTVGGATEAPPTKRGNWGMTALGTVAQGEKPQVTASGTSAAPGAVLPPGNSARGQLASQTDLAYRAATLRATGDLAARRDFDAPPLSVPENRNWLVTGDATQGKVRETATVGLGSPTFASQAQIVTAGLPRLGVETRVAGGRFAMSGYQSFDSGTAAVAGSGSFDQTLRGAGIGFGKDVDRVNLRAVFLDVDSRAGPMTTGGHGQLYGLLGSFKLSNTVTVTGEAGHGSFEPNGESSPPLATTLPPTSLPSVFVSQATPDPTSLPSLASVLPGGSTTSPGGAQQTGVLFAPLSKQSGDAWRVTAMGMIHGLSFAANYRQSDAGFANPANPGYTAGGTSGLRGADLTLNGVVIGGKGSLGLTLRHADSPLSGTAGAPRVSDDGGNLMLSLRAGRYLTASAASNVSFRHGDADDAASLPKTDSRMLGESFTLAETVGKLTVSEMTAYQTQKDHVNPYGDSRTLCVSVSAAGALGPHLTLNVMGNGTRSAGSPEMGTTEMWMLNAQPTLQFPKAWLTLAPRAAYSQMRNSVQASKSTTEQYGGALTLTPPWYKSLLGFVVQGDWARARGAGLADEGRFKGRVAAVITVRWSAGRGATFAAPTAATPVPTTTGMRTMAALAHGLTPASFW